MPDEQAQQPSPGSGEGAAMVEPPKTSPVVKQRKRPQRGKVRRLPPYKVLLHDDDVNDMQHVVLSILKLTNFSIADAERTMLEAHRRGMALLLVTHRERAELYVEQFGTFNLTVTIEPDE